MKFIKQFLKNPVETAAIVASSKRLSQLIVDSAELNQKRCVVELGPGTGAFTKEILKEVSPEALFFCLEINHEFVTDTRRNCPDAIVYHASATDIKKYLNVHGRNTCDCIISGLPWALFGKELQEELLENIYDSLERGGSFLTIAHISGLLFPPGIRFHKLLSRKFYRVRKTEVVWGNVLPGFVYHCVK